MYTVTEFVHILEKALGNCTNETLKSKFIKSRAGSCVSGSAQVIYWQNDRNCLNHSEALKFCLLGLGKGDRNNFSR